MDLMMRMSLFLKSFDSMLVSDVTMFVSVASADDSNDNLFYWWWWCCCNYCYFAIWRWRILMLRKAVKWSTKPVSYNNVNWNKHILFWLLADCKHDTWECRNHNGKFWFLALFFLLCCNFSSHIEPSSSWSCQFFSFSWWRSWEISWWWWLCAGGGGDGVGLPSASSLGLALA